MSAKAFLNEANELDVDEDEEMIDDDKSLEDEDECQE